MEVGCEEITRCDLQTGFKLADGVRLLTSLGRERDYKSSLELRQDEILQYSVRLNAPAPLNHAAIGAFLSAARQMNSH